MERIGKYLQAQALPNPGRKTSRWAIVGNYGDTLGTVQWFGRWRQYTFDPAPSTTFNDACLTDIAAFLARVNREQRTTEPA